MIASTFKDPALENQIDRQGYVYIPGFYSAFDIKEMLALYRSVHSRKKDPDSGQWNSLIHMDPALSKEVSEKILELLRPKLNLLLNDTYTPVATFLSKYPGERSWCDMHRDFSILDESKFEYRNIWIPLIDIDEQNGALFVLPGSHKIFREELPMTQPWMYMQHSPALMKYVKTFYTKAGDLIVYKDKLVHGSHLNNTDDTRPVIHLGTLPEEARTCFYYLHGKEVEVYNVEPDYFFKNDLGEPPVNGKPFRTFPYTYPEYTTREIEKLVTENMPQ